MCQFAPLVLLGEFGQLNSGREIGGITLEWSLQGEQVRYCQSKNMLVILVVEDFFYSAQRALKSGVIPGSAMSKCFCSSYVLRLLVQKEPGYNYGSETCLVGSLSKKLKMIVALLENVQM